MSPWRFEHDRPSEWLRWLAEEQDAYRILLAHAGGLARAAYRLASAHCRARGGPGEMPTLRDLQAAARALAGELGVSGSLPISSLLERDGDAQGWPALRPVPPISRRSSAPPLRRAS